MTTAAAIVSSGLLRCPANVPMPSTMAAYTAVTPADSKVTSSARLMITSMSNSRRRKIAIAMAAGMPSSARSAEIVYGTPCSGLSCWPTATARMPTLWQIRKPVTTRASHFICWRSRWSPRRYRITSDTTAGASSSGNTTPRPFRVPSRAAGSTDRIASGLG